MRIFALAFLLTFLFAICNYVLAHDAGVASQSFAPAEGNAKRFPHELIAGDPTAAPTIVPTPSPSPKPSSKPTAKKSPTRAPTQGIYVKNDNIILKEKTQQDIVAALTVLLFFFMAVEFLSPEILFMIALIIVMLCQILTIGETLSGKLHPPRYTVATTALTS